MLSVQGVNIDGIYRRLIYGLNNGLFPIIQVDGDTDLTRRQASVQIFLTPVVNTGVD